ncbi:hypothetical protein ACU61T_20500 [Klebsiella aerogenes]
MNKPIWMAVDPADESGDYTAVTAVVYRITGRLQYPTFTLIGFRAFILTGTTPLDKSCISGIGSDEQGIRRGSIVRMQLINDDDELSF